MSGTILENLSNKKLSVIMSIILVILLVSFFIGAFWAPAPSSTEQVLAIKCLTTNESEFAIPRVYRGHGKVESKNCIPTESQGDITFAFQIPLPKDGHQLDYSRWMANLLTILIPDVLYDERIEQGRPNDDDEYINATVRIRVRLGVRNINDKEWKEYSRKDNLKRTIKCKIEKERRIHQYKYDCDLIQLFELQSVYYDYYLINLKFISHEGSDNFGFLNDLSLVAIHQNGGFTKIWLSMKTFFTLTTLLTLLWFSKRLNQLHRDMTLLEKTLTALGYALTQLNVPIEFLSLYFDIEFMTFLSDLRQGILHCALLCFWIIFIGEHLLDGVHRSRLSSYYKHISIVLVAYLCLFIFDLTERGIQWVDPFFTIWDVDTRVAYVFLGTATSASIAYFFHLTYHIWLVFRNISSKQTSLPAMSSTRRLIYQGIIYRFKFLLAATIVCAAATVLAYIMGQVTEDQWYWEDSDAYVYSPPLQWTSAMFTTVYSLWNCYVITLLILYAPSHKGPQPHLDSMSEEIEFNRLTEDRNEGTPTHDAGSSTLHEEPSEMQLLQQLASKQSVD